MTVREFITRHEGRMNTPYKCPAGKRTIGIGWNYDDNPLPKDIRDYLQNNGRILEEHIDRLFTIALIRSVNDCKKLFPDFENFSHNRKMALTDFLYNVGLTTASKFKKAITCINHEAWDDAAKHMQNSLWFQQVGNRAKEVIQLIKEG